MRAALLWIASTGCYDPGAVNCTVSCAGAGECASGQVCGSDGFCAAPEVAGRCSTVDAGTSAQLVALKVVITGKGKVTVDGVGYCDSGEEQSAGPVGQCTFMVGRGAVRRLVAVENHGKDFLFWSIACLGISPTCIVTPTLASTTVGAKFE